MEKDLEQRTKRFALAMIKFSSALPRSREMDVLLRQLIRSATSIEANYREANRGVSRADFANKIGTNASSAPKWIGSWSEIFAWRKKLGISCHPLWKRN